MMGTEYPKVLHKKSEDGKYSIDRVTAVSAEDQKKYEADGYIDETDRDAFTFPKVLHKRVTTPDGTVRDDTVTAQSEAEQKRYEADGFVYEAAKPMDKPHA